jgi:hypothetical protein
MCVDVHVDVHVVMSDNGGMNPTDLATIEDYTTLQPGVRAFLTGKLQALIETLEPYCDGTFELSPRMVEVYLRTLREMGLLYRVYDPPRADPDPEQEQEELAPLKALEAARRDILAQLEELELRTR